jgi:hypothetical protein
MVGWATVTPLLTDVFHIRVGPRGRLCGCYLLLCWALAGLALAWPLLAHTGERAASENIHLLGKRLQDAPPALRSDFALAVLSELIPVYRREAVRARSEFQRTSTHRDSSRWAAAVDALVRDLQRLLEGLSPETPVQVTAQDPQTLYVIVDGNPVLLTGPRANENTLLEQGVMERFCSRNDCNDLVGDRQLEASVVGHSESAALWRFNDPAGPVCASGDGLELQFRNDTNLREKRQACTEIMAELNVLANRLRSRIRSGKAVDWNRLAVDPTAGTDLQRIILDGAGDYVLMSLPSLERAHTLFVQILPWLAARVGDKRYNLVILNTETKLGVPALASGL